MGERIPDDHAERVLARALQGAWDDWCSDTGCIPDGFTIRGPRTTRVEADFQRSGNFMVHTVQWLEAAGFVIARKDGLPYVLPGDPAPAASEVSGS